MLREDEVWNLGRIFLGTSIAHSYFILLFDIADKNEIDQIPILLDKEINTNTHIEDINKDLALESLCNSIDPVMLNWDDDIQAIFGNLTSSILLEDPFFLGGKPMDFLNDLASRWPEEGLYENIEPIRNNLAEDLSVLVLQNRELDFKKMDEIINEKWIYLGPILRNARLKGVDRYGEKDLSLFIQECDEFAERFFTKINLTLFSQNDSAQHRYVSRVAIHRLLLEENLINNDMPEDGHSFEYWCATELNKYGWVCTVTKGSNDQGVDIVARKNLITVAIQCKRYSAAVGNKAVQEIYAGQRNINADYACVITTSSYTKSAIELSLTTNVLLLHINEIQYLSDYLK